MTPQERAALVALVEKWNGEADQHVATAASVTGVFMADIMRSCARELKAALAAAPAGEPVGEPTPSEALCGAAPPLGGCERAAGHGGDHETVGGISWRNEHHDAYRQPTPQPSAPQDGRAERPKETP
jgi:hypothetical protein